MNAAGEMVTAILSHAADQRDLEGVVAKRKFDPYLLDGSATWFKIRNRNYSQWIGREKLFDRERDSNPDWQIWNLCTLACDQSIEAYGEASPSSGSFASL